MHEEENIQVQDPGPLRPNRPLDTLLAALAVVGVAVFIAGLGVDSTRVWYNYLLEYYFFLALGLSGLVLTAVHYVTGATWSVTVRRVAEGLSAYLPWALALSLPLFFAVPELYTWALPSTVHMFHEKHIYLNRAFYMGREAFGFAIWLGLGAAIVRNSLRQDRGEGALALYSRNRKLAPAFLILFGLTFTFVSVDLLMSLDENWYSTMFPVYCFAGLFLSGLALTTVLTVFLRRAGYLAQVVRPHHLYDLGTWIMAFSCFMVYIGFSQYMLIWYTNMPVEIVYLLKRSTGGWGWVFLLLPLLKWLLPFVVLMPSKLRGNESVLLFVGLGVLLGQWLDVYWMVAPVFSESLRLPGWIEIGLFLGFAGMFGLALRRFFRRHSLAAFNDPRIEECMKGRYLHV